MSMEILDKASGSLSTTGMIRVARELVSLHGGSIQALLDTLSERGLRLHVKSWVGGGHNLPVGRDEIRQALGDDGVRQLAERLGVAPEPLLVQLSEHLPGIIEQLAPGGQVPRGGMPLAEPGLAAIAAGK